MLNSKSQAGTKADSEQMPIVELPATITQNPMLVAAKFSQMEFEIIMPHGAMGIDASDTMLVTFLRQFSEKYQEKGEWAEKYGTCYQSNKIIMQRYCWCEKEQCPYCWSFEDGKPTKELIETFGMDYENTAPNFWYKPLDFKVWWYKYIGRSVHVNKKLSMDEFSKMMADCMI